MAASTMLSANIDRKAKPADEGCCCKRKRSAQAMKQNSIHFPASDPPAWTVGKDRSPSTCSKAEPSDDFDENGGSDEEVIMKRS